MSIKPGRKIVEKLIAARKARGLSQMDLAHVLGGKEYMEIVERVEEYNDDQCETWEIRMYAEAVGYRLVVKLEPLKE